MCDHIITDEKLFQIAANFEEPAELWQGQMVFSSHAYLALARKMIALAQEVTDLEWCDSENESYCSEKIVCKTDDGRWSACIKKFANTYSLCDFYTREEAKYAANADNRKRVLSQLKYGHFVDTHRWNDEVSR